MDGSHREPKEDHTTAEQTERWSTPILEENKSDDTLEMENTALSPVYGREDES